VPELLQLLTHSRSDVRLFASEALKNIGPGASQAVRALVDKFREVHEEPMVRASALKALETMGPSANVAVPDLPNLLVEGDWLVRQSAAEALSRLGRGSADRFFSTVPETDNLLKEEDRNNGTRRADALADALKRLDDAPTGALIGVVPRLIALFQDGRYDVRRLSADVLGSIGADARNALAAGKDVQQAMETQKTRGGSPALVKERQRIDAALGRLKDVKDALAHIEATLIPELRDRDAWVRMSAANALTRVNPQVAVPSFANLLPRERDPAVQRCFAEALGSIGANLENVADVRQRQEMLALIETALSALLGDADWHTRESAVRALGQIGPPAEAALPRLKEVLLGDESLTVKSDVLEAIGKIANPSQAVVPKPALSHVAATLRGR